MIKGFLIYEEMRKYLVLYEEAISLCNRSFLDFLVYEEKIFLSFLSVYQVNVATYKKIQLYY